MTNLLVTGAAGFIGSCFAIQEIGKGHKVVALDVCSYSARMENLSHIIGHENFTFVKGDICDASPVARLLREHKIDAVVHFAAESHVDNSIKGPEIFIRTNVLGTYVLLWESLQYWRENGRPDDFRFIHVSTDEVFGELALNTADKFTELSQYAPNSPYSASKAASDHLARAWLHTYGLPVIITNCSNNYGPRQHHEKLIPHMIKCALSGKPLPVYGAGENVRDWIFVEDHARGVALALAKGVVGESYCFGGGCERRNIDVVEAIAAILDARAPLENGASYRSLISFVEDRLGHDLRYAIDDTKARQALGFATTGSFEDHLAKTIEWYLEDDDRLT